MILKLNCSSKVKYLDVRFSSTVQQTCSTRAFPIDRLTALTFDLNNSLDGRWWKENDSCQWTGRLVIDNWWGSHSFDWQLEPTRVGFLSFLDVVEPIFSFPFLDVYLLLLNFHSKENINLNGCRIKGLVVGLRRNRSRFRSDCWFFWKICFILFELEPLWSKKRNIEGTKK